MWDALFVNTTCKYCGFSISPSFYFCPNCGKKLAEPPKSTSIGKQLYIYTISILLPPLGLMPGIKYLMDKNQKAKIIGIIAIVLTVISSVISIYLTLSFLNSQASFTNNQIDQLQNLGY